jgi:hypothetical protein
VTRVLHALATLGVSTRSKHANSWALRLRSGNIRSVNAMRIKSFCRLLLPPRVGKGRGGWPHGKEKGKRPCTAWQGY